MNKRFITNELLIKLAEVEGKRIQEEKIKYNELANMDFNEKLMKATSFAHGFIMDEYNIRLHHKQMMYESIIKDSYGSFNGQYEEVCDVLNALKFKLYCNDYVKSEGDIKTYEVNKDDCKYILIWNNNAYGDKICHGKTYKNENGKIVIELKISSDKIYFLNLISTLAHEIMHKHQYTIKPIDGINENGLNLYCYLPYFSMNAPTDFSQYFFNGLYACFSHERKANISSVSDYLGELFKNGFETDNPIVELTNAIKESEKYKGYEDVLNCLTTTEPNAMDVKYITERMTTPLKNIVTNSNEMLPFFEKEGFNVELFIKKNREQIIKQCKYTMRKMLDNVTLFLEKKGLV